MNSNTTSVTDTQASVKEYYGKTLQSSADLQTDACCTMEALPEFAKPILSEVHDEVMMKYYGCGIVIPESIEGCRILDLGSGSGRDCYVLSKLVGENGEIVGVDMTDEQLEVANRHKDFMADKYGYKKSNVSFLKGDIEKLEALGLEPGSFDCITSNCVVNLAENKEAVLQSAYHLLCEGGEFYFSDVYADRRIPEELVKDPVLYGECLSGALYVNDFTDLAKRVGFADPRVVTSRTLGVQNKEIEKKLGNIQFYSTTYRLFKDSTLEPRCEDYGQAVRYKGTIENFETAFQLDDGHTFEAGRVYTVCGNTYQMLNKTRFKDHFDFWGDFSTHYGLYDDCGTSAAPAASRTESTSSGASCC